MKPRRLPEWQDRAEEAIVAMEKGEWWDGERWRAHADLPSPDHEGTLNSREAEAHQTAHEVLAEALNAIGAGGRGRRSARKFKQHEKADRDYHASTMSEIEADAIFKAAQPYLGKKPLSNRPGFTDVPTSRTAWAKLAKYLSRPEQLGREVKSNRLRMICRKRGAQ